MGKKTKNSILKIFVFTLLVILLIIVAALVSYIVYLYSSYSRLDPIVAVKIDNKKIEQVELNKEYSLTTYNIGFGAYESSYSFFMDKGEMRSGEKTQGKYSRGLSIENTLTNTLTSVALIRNISPSFAFFQEVDVKSDRSYFINQKEIIDSFFPDYSSTFALNFHSPYLFYPILAPHGRVQSGLLTLSKYSVSSAIRYSYPISNDFSKFFDLDRCFLLSKVPIKGTDKELILINSHMSAYDKGGIIRKKQLERLNDILQEEKNKGNYVICGGDFNHVLGEDLVGIFQSNEIQPSWVSVLDDKDISPGFKIVKADNALTTSTCRGTDIPYQKGVSYEAILDGFIVSDNIECNAFNIDTDFISSDHNPVLLSFILK